MKFPKQELDVSAYLQKIKELLNDDSCHIFIDTNIISQLYRLNELARHDFYDWVDSCKDRFHIPNWSVHEYSKRVTTQNTKDYLSELAKAKTYSKELANMSQFIKGYVGNSLLVGSEYADKKDQLFKDIDSVVNKFDAIANAINKNLTAHQQRVHKEVLDKLDNYTIDSNIYRIIGRLSFEHDLRFDGKIPPGFKDSDKTANRIGDLIIWKEIIDFCVKGKLKDKTAKVIFISRDIKPDMVYRPLKQKRGGNPIKEEDKIEIAHESLVYEFKLATNSDDFYLISFYTLVQILASNYQDLAISFQIATEQENALPIFGDTLCINDEAADDNKYVSELGETGTEPQAQLENETPQPKSPPNNTTYSKSAFADSNYDTAQGLVLINECIENLKTYNWYKQNPAINKLSTLSFDKVEDNQQNRDSIFVLGRNILQSADGTAGSATSFLDNLHSSISNWPKSFQQAFIDGCLYEVFFNSSGKIRPKGFKSSYFQTIVNEVNKMDITNVFNFINEELDKKNEGRFVPKVNSEEKYRFEFSFSKMDEFNNVKTLSLKINKIDVSETFKMNIGYNFSYSSNLKNKLALYYAIPEENIELDPLPPKEMAINFIVEENGEDMF